MNLKTLMNKPLSEVVKEMKLIDTKIHSDNNGNIKCIELKYTSETDNDKSPSNLGWK